MTTLFLNTEHWENNSHPTPLPISITVFIPHIIQSFHFSIVTPRNPYNTFQFTFLVRNRTTEGGHTNFVLLFPSYHNPLRSLHSLPTSSRTFGNCPERKIKIVMSSQNLFSYPSRLNTKFSSWDRRDYTYLTLFPRLHFVSSIKSSETSLEPGLYNYPLSSFSSFLTFQFLYKISILVILKGLYHIKFSYFIKIYIWKIITYVVKTLFHVQNQD